MEFENLYRSVREYIERNDGTKIAVLFRSALGQYIKQKEISNSALYKKARIDRRLYWKCLRSNDYHTSKKTVISLGLALELNINEMSKLLESAGFSFNFRSISDLVIKYCVEHAIFNIETVNMILVEIGEKPLHKE
jgi:hypothetical protein